MSIPIRQKTYTLLSHNVASIQTNPIEYKSTLRQLVDTTKDARLRVATECLLRIDRKYENKEDLPTIHIEAMQGVLPPHLATCATFLPSIPFKKALTELVEEERKETSDAITLFRKYKTYGKVDKLLREMNIKQPSLTGYNEEMMAYCAQAQTMSLAHYATSWFRTIATYLIPLYKKSYTQRKDNNFAKDIILTFAFDWWLVQRIFSEEDGPQAWRYLATQLQHSALGNVEKKAMALFGLYEKWHPDIICLQESNINIMQYLLQQGYIMAEDDPRKNQQAGTLNSIILYKQDSFPTAKITTIHLDSSLEKKYKANDVLPMHARRLYTSELTLNLLIDDKKTWFIASFHADTAGHNTLLACQLIYKAKRSYEKKTGQKVELIMGMDGNTTNKPSTEKNKRNLEDLLHLIKGYKTLQILQYAGSDTDTVHKVRSSLQLQLDKAHVWSKGISDCIMLSTSFSIVDQQQSPHGPSLPYNPSDHKALCVSFEPK